MKERPILFSGAMVRALLEGRKTQTRRVLKVQPSESHFMPERDSLLMGPRMVDFGEDGQLFPDMRMHVIFDYTMGEVEAFNCPYGRPGDRLWVRETLRRSDDNWWGMYAADDEWVVSRPPFAPLRVPWNDRRDPCLCRSPKRSYVPSIHMPRLASRIMLEIVSVRVERVQDISEKDACAEGALRNDAPGEYWDGTYLTQRYVDGIEGAQDDEPWGTARDWYREVWDSINRKPGTRWRENPWVWVVEFRRV